MEQQKKRDYEIYWPHVILVGAIALVLVLIGVVIGVNIGKSKKYKPVPVTGQGYTWTLQPGRSADDLHELLAVCESQLCVGWRYSEL